MPIAEHPPLPQGRPPFKVDIPAPRRPSLESPNTEQPTINPEDEKRQPKIVQPESDTLLVKPKPKPPPHPDQPPRESEYEDDIKIPMVERETLRQLLDLDDDDRREFSSEMVREYFAQAEAKFDEMDEQFALRDLPELSTSGHFLKGSSAALGLTRVQNTCEKIQHCGDESSDTVLSEEDLMDIDRLLKQVRSQYTEAKEWLLDFFDNNRSLEEVSFYPLAQKTSG